MTRINDQAVVVEQLFSEHNAAQRLDEHPAIRFVRLAIGIAGMVDPARRVAAVQGVDHAFFIDVEIEGMVRVGRIVRMAALRLLPADDGSDIFDDHLALGQIAQGKHPFSVHAGAPGLDASRVCRNRFFGHV